MIGNAYTHQAVHFLKWIIMVVVGVSCIGADAKIPPLVSHPWSALYVFVVVSRTLGGVWAGVAALMVAIYFVTLFSERTPAVPIEAALFIVASAIGLVDKWLFSRRKDTP